MDYALLVNESREARSLPWLSSINVHTTYPFFPLLCRLCDCFSWAEKMATEEELKVPRIKLGSQGLEVSAQGLGCMGMSAFYGPPKPEPEMIELIHYAIDRGITHFDTAEMYGPYTNEILLGKVIIIVSCTLCFSCCTFSKLLKDDLWLWHLFA